MTRGFRRTRDGRVAVRLSGDEVGLLRNLVEQVLDLVDEGGSGADRSGAPSGDEHSDAPGASELASMLGIRESARPPDDPVLARLFPDGYRDDAEAAGEFRRYTEDGLRDAKRTAAGEVLASTSGGGGTFTVDVERADAWLRVLNDVRLALGTRLEIGEDAHEELSRMDPADPRYPGYVAYDWLSFLQESLVRALW